MIRAEHTIMYCNAVISHTQVSEGRTTQISKDIIIKWNERKCCGIGNLMGNFFQMTYMCGNIRLCNSFGIMEYSIFRHMKWGRKSFCT